MTANKSSLTDDAARAYGVEPRHERMGNGELRFRLMADDGSGYIRTVASDVGAWQNSHYHKAAIETYIVQRGWVGFVELVDGGLVWGILTPGDVYTTRPGIPHNVYLPASSVIHTVKHGDLTTETDWYSSADLDSRTKTVSEEEILQNGRG